MQTTVEETTSRSRAESARAPRRGIVWYHEKGLTAVVVLFFLVILIAIYDPTFLSLTALMSLLDQSAVLALLALAQAVIVFTGRITLAHAALASMAGVILAGLLPSFGWMGVLVTLLATSLAGMLLGLTHVIGQVPSFIVTLGGMGVFSGLALWVSGADTVFVATGYETLEWITWRFFGVPISFLLVLCISLVLMGGFGALPLGRGIRAVGFNERAAAFSGIKTGAVVVTVFTLSGLLSGMAATFQVAELQAAGATTMDSLLLPSIAAVLLGGTAITGGVGGIGRTLVGVLIITVLRVGLDIVGVPSSIQPILYGAIVILAIAATVDRGRGRTVS